MAPDFGASVVSWTVDLRNDQAIMVIRECIEITGTPNRSRFLFIQVASLLRTALPTEADRSLCEEKPVSSVKWKLTDGQ